ncbi:MAG TPA: SRPBCC family protein [Humibacillus xanthopallidus]|nr:SRPBCC family protein [Humibacillus xanthopallidus]
MVWERTAGEVFACPPSVLWDVVGDPRRWPEWCDAVGPVVMTEPVTVGARLRYEPAGRLSSALHRRTAPPMRVTAHVPGRRLAIEQPIPSGAMTVEWTVDPETTAGGEPGCRLRQRIVVDGLLSPAVVVGVASGLAASWPRSVARLHALVA